MSNSLLVHLFLINPGCQWILSNRRFVKPWNFIYAILFLTSIALATEFYEVQQRPPNYYRLLQVDKTASMSDLKKAFKTMSLKYHPDKNPAPDAQTQFTYIGEAYEVLSDSELRRYYDYYGSIGTGAEARRQMAQRDFSTQITSMVSYYIMWGLLTYLMTIGKSSSQAREWSFVGLIASFIMEYYMLFGGWDPLSTSLLTRTTIREKIDLLHALYPAFMHGARLFSQFIFVDLEKHTQEMLAGIIQTNAIIIETLRHIQESVDRKKSTAGTSTVGDSLKQVAEENLTVAQKLKRAEAEAHQRQLLQQQQQKSGGIPGWVIMVGMYVLFNYILK